MSNTYLPADVRTRIVDLMKANKVTQKKLALTIGVHESTLGRFLNGTTEKLSEESVIRIANAFNVSTDFIWALPRSPIRRIMIFLSWACLWKPPRIYTPAK